jgi:hypothetical protein
MFFGKNKSDKKYKFNSIKVYAWDRAVGSKKKFRRLFERAELNYVSVELSFYNKLFDEDDWEANVEIILNSIDDDKKTKKITQKKEKVTVSKDDNIYIYSFGWGSDTRGEFWKKGNYEWEAYIDGNHIGSTKFYVEDGTVEFFNNKLLILSPSAIQIEKLAKQSIEKMIEESKVLLKKSEVKDKEKYILSYKINSLQEIN